jgi:hypothetical protein
MTMTHFPSFNSLFVRLTILAGLLLGPILPAHGAPVSAAQPAAARPASVSYVLDRAARLDDPAVRREVALAGAAMSAAERNTTCLAYYHQIIAAETDLDAFTHLVELAAALSNDHADSFMLMVSNLTLDATSNTQALLAGAWGRVKNTVHVHLLWFPGYPALGRFGSTGFRADDGGNQAQHFWYSVAISYRWGATIARLEARYHEWNAPGLLRYLPGTGQGRGSAMDLALSQQGIDLGRRLATQALTPSQVARWMRAELAQ